MSPDKGVFARIAESDAAKGLGTSLSNYMTSRAAAPLRSKASKAAEDATESVGSTDEQQGSGLMDRVKSGAGGGAVKGAIKGAIDAIKPGGGATKRPHNIVEDLWVGVPVEQCWDEWIKYEDYPGYMKGPQKVGSEDQDEDGQLVTNWTAKIFLSSRSWKSTLVEEVEYERIRWESEGAKGVVEGAISFTPVGDNATLMLVVIEYRSKGPIEWIGNRWRTVGRRIRLDLKHFRRHVMMLEASQEQSDEEPDEQPDEEQPTEEQEQEQAGA